MFLLRCIPPSLIGLGLAVGLSAGAARATDAHRADPPAAKAAPTPSGARPAAAPAPAARPGPGTDPQVVVERIRNALTRHAEPDKLHVLVGDELLLPASGAAPAASAPGRPARRTSAATARNATQAGHGTAHRGEIHWSYAGEHGPEQWGHLKPEFSTCATGQRQTPIHIQSSQTLQGPAEPLRFAYSASGGSVVHNGHTVQVDVDGDNGLTVRGSRYRLLQFHFHHPAEEKINHQGFAMVAHLVHRNDLGQLAVVAVLMDPGEANALIHKVWTHMPLDRDDRVRLPDALIDLNELLPKDPRYFQFMGSLTTPPCTEGVLWLVMKQPVSISREQLRLFAQVFPMNARPVQALNGRAVREGM